MDSHHHTTTNQIYTCPMHPEIKRDTPGICPDCGMNLVSEKKQTASQSQNCSCFEKCLCYGAERLTVAGGCNMEAKQYEYNLAMKCCHTEHTHEKKVAAEPNKNEKTIYTCPMHPQVKKTEPGRCPACGMELIPQTIDGDMAARGGHDLSQINHQDHEAAMTNPQIAKKMEADMRRRFWVSLALSIPIFLYSPVGINFFGFNLPTPVPVNWLLLVLTTPIVFWTGSIFITGTYYSLKARKLNMAVLIATGVLAAYLFSALLTLIRPDSETFYEAAALLVTFVLFGHWMEMKSRRGTSDALRALFDLVPPQASVIRDGQEILIPSAEVVKDDIVVIRPGNKIPVDGEVVEGETYIDESLVTGESLPVHKKLGGSVVGGSINQSGSIKFKAIKVGSDTVLAHIIKMVETAQNSKAPGQRLADTAAGWLVIVAIGSGLAAFFGWYIVAGVGFITALTFAVSTVVIACPDALGLATPTAVAVGTGIGAKHNILIKDATTLEKTSKINAMILDKTGTLTKGQPEVTDVVSFIPPPSRIPRGFAAEVTNGFKFFSHGSIRPEKVGGFIESKRPEVQLNILQLAVSIEKYSEHPLAKTIVEKASKEGVELFTVSKFEAVAGQGVKGFIVDPAAGIGKPSAGESHLVLLGNKRLMETNQTSVSHGIRQTMERLQSEGKTAMFLALDKEVIGIIAVADTPRENSERAVAELKKNGIEIIMITGDNERTAAAIAKQLGVDRVFAEVLPAEKANWVKKLQDEGKFVAMVGDGINDAPALAQADIGIAIGAGTDVAIETGNIVLMKSDPYDIVAAIRLSKATVVKMKQNLFWAAIYNVLAIPVAAGVFYNSFGLSLRPEISALLMSASSIIVASNAVLLKRVESKLKL
ncbi:MAG: copper-translocating P-type ATPase [Candidatus Kerfeldbacteria bacterium]|nr:copper-translocating P-type ATPase [Candidatus Kerfeldbacteria bacterium]